jgi:protein-tyrosine-phosphatase
MTTGTKTVRILFLCTGNSARSQMAEAIARHLGRGSVEAVSAGTAPREQVHPEALRTLAEMGIDARGLRPKHVDGVQQASYDYAITVCDKAREQCPLLPGAKMTHWSFFDPAAAPPDRARDAFQDVALALFMRISLLLEYHAKHGGPSATPLGADLLRFATKRSS